MHDIKITLNLKDIEYSLTLYGTNNLERLLNRSSETLPRSLKSTRTTDCTRKANPARYSAHYSSSTLPKSYHKSRSMHRKTLTPPPPTPTLQPTTVPSYNKVIEKNGPETKSSGPSSLESTTTNTNKSGPSSLESQVTIVPFNKSTKSSSNKNAFTLQVKTNQKKQNSNENNNLTVTKSMTTINSGKNTKIYVENSPVRSVITFGNRQKDDNDPNVVIINGSEVEADDDIHENRKDQKNKLNENMNNENQKMNNKDDLSILKSNLLKSENSLEHLDVINNCWPLTAEPNSNLKSKVFQFPSLNDLHNFNNFSSLTAQKILKGINSVETLIDKH